MSRAFVLRHDVTFDETNLVGNVYFAHYVRWQGHCRERFLATEAPGLLAALSHGDLALVTISCSVDFLAESFAGDAIDVLMFLASYGPYRISMVFEYRRNEQLIATGRQEVACMQRGPVGELAPSSLPRDLASALTRYSDSSA